MQKLRIIGLQINKKSNHFRLFYAFQNFSKENLNRNILLIYILQFSIFEE